MHHPLPNKVTLMEVGPRDGFQFESKIVPTELKVEIINELAAAGLKHIQVTAFVHPGKIPQMADAEMLVKRLPIRADVTYSGLTLNTKGVERAHLAGLENVEVSISASDTHSLKNAGMSIRSAKAQAREMIDLAHHFHMRVRAGIQCAFGCAYEGLLPPDRIVDMVENYLEKGVDALCLADTTGMATPPAIEQMLETILPMAGTTPVVFHLHDSRGLGLVNMTTALESGITRFDTAMGGMGGCPFAPGAAGNIATEDTLYLLESLGIQTGVDASRVARCSMKMEKFFNKSFAGKNHRLL